MRIPTRPFLLFLLLISQVFSVAGQSGRKTPAQPSAEPLNVDGSFLPDPNRDEYRLIVPGPSKPERRKQIRSTSEKRKFGVPERWEFYASGFSQELNRVGAQGYRVGSIAFSPELAVMRRAEHQYEYAVIGIASRRRLFPNDPEFALTYEPWARKGFRVADYVVLLDWCFSSMTDMNGDFSPSVDCNYSSQVLLERRKGAAEMPREYKIVHPQPTFSKTQLEGDLTEEIDNARNTNLYATHLLTKFQLLTQSPTSVDDLAAKEYETAIVSGDVKKRVNELAQQGYRLILRPLFLEAAIMHRKKGAIEPASYIWVAEKKLEQELPGFQQQGFIYRMHYGCGTGSGMIFEQPSEGYDRPREYKVMAIELSSTDAAEELKRLTKDGFEVRDFFACHTSKKKGSGAKLLLERVK